MLYNGDFNLNLLNCQNHKLTNEFLDTTVRIKKRVIELCSALARLLYNLQKSFFRRWIDQAFSF